MPTCTRACPQCGVITDLKWQICDKDEEFISGVIVRSKELWVEQSENPIKYFFNLEKMRQQKKEMTDLKSHSGGTLVCSCLNSYCKVCTISFERPEASPLNVYSPSAIISLSLLNSILMACFLKQSFAQTCLIETDNGKLHQFNY